jgi:hypothetical protein
MSNTSDVINLVRDILLPIGVPIFKLGHGSKIKIGSEWVEAEGTERIVLNSIPVTQARAGTLKQNNDVVNINVFIPKIQKAWDSKRIEDLDALIQNTIESFSGVTSRVKYSYLDVQPSQTFNESDLETLTNIRIEITYT